MSLDFTDVDKAVETFENARMHAIAGEVSRSFGVPLTSFAAEGDGPSQGDLSDLLNSVGKAPGATPVATVPESPQSYELELLENVQTLESYIAVLTALVIYNKHPEPYDLSDGKQAMQFVIDTANAKNYVMSGGTVKDIALYLPGMSASSDHKSITTTTATIHVDLLKTLFSGLSLAAGALTELDGVLTDVVDTLKNLKLSFQSQTETFNHQISYYYLAPVEGSNPPINQMKVRFLYLEVDQKSWKAAVAKSKVEHFSFDMKLTTTDSVMNSGMVSSNSAAIAKSCVSLTSKDPEEIQKLIGSKGIKVKSS